MSVKDVRIKDLVRFMKAREKERLRKLGRARGFGDPIIQKYRFCNVRRNDDRVTIWIQEEVFQRFAGDPHMWFAFVVARLFNLPDSLEEVMDCILPFKPELMRKRLHLRREAGLKIFNAAYIVSTNGQRTDKIDYVVQQILQPIWVKRVPITLALKGATLEQAHDLLMRQNGLGSFMAAQVLADYKYEDPSRWSDFDTFAASGPGSKRGLNRVMLRDRNTGLTELRFREELAYVRNKVNKLFPKDQTFTAQDIQNCLCEYDKYQRVATGEGEPKQLYKPYNG